MQSKAAITLWILALLFPLLVPGGVAADGEKEVDDGIDVYFREADLMSVANQGLEKYPETEPGESQNLERAFPGAPPLIPHSVVDMMQIYLDDNECIECHHPDNVESKEDMPIPESHFKRVVMRKGTKDEAMVWVVKGYETGDSIGARHNCTMCHAPAATNVDTPATTFIIEKEPAK